MDELKGVIIRHKCDNPGCCNPEHLESGTQKDNVADMFSRGRANRPWGSRCHRSKLSEEDVLSIRSMLTGKRGEFTRIANLFGVTRTNIAKISKGFYWRNLTDGQSKETEA